MIGKRILQLRKELKLTQEDLGKRVGVSKATISLWEKNETKPKGENLLKLARALACTPDYITDGKASAEPPAQSIPLIEKRHISDYVAGVATPFTDPGPNSAAIAAAFNAGPRTFAFKEDSTGMAPRISPGDTVYIDPGVTPAPAEPVTGVWLAIVQGAPVLGSLDQTPSGIVLTFDSKSAGWESIPLNADQLAGKMIAFTPAWL